MSGANTVKVACIGYVFIPEAEPIIRDLAPEGFELQFAEHPSEETAKWLETADFLFTVAPVSEETLAGAPNLRMIQKWGIGVDKIDLPAADRHGVHVAITAGANAATVSEHTMMLMLSVMRRVTLADRAIREGRWIVGEIRPQARKLLDKTIGIVGFGNIGRGLAKRLRGFDVNVTYFDVAGTFDDVGKELGATPVSMDQLLAESDILSLHCPGGGANRHLIDAEKIAKMKPGVILLNAARGDLIDEAALVAALESGQVSGAGLDVFETEPRGETPLAKFDNVVMTPHSAGSVMDNVGPMAAHGLNNMQRVLRGEALPAADVIVAPKNPRVPLAAKG